jgi:hypothetical protein
MEEKRREIVWGELNKGEEDGVWGGKNEGMDRRK